MMAALAAARCASAAAARRALAAAPAAGGDAMSLRRFVELYHRAGAGPSADVGRELAQLVARADARRGRRFFEDAVANICSQQRGRLPARDGAGAPFHDKVAALLRALHALGPGLAPNTEMYTSFVCALCRRGQLREAFVVLRRMQEAGVLPNEVTYTAVLAALARRGETREAEELLGLMQGEGLRPDTVTYSALVKAYAVRGDARGARKVLRTMREEGVPPNEVTYGALIEAEARAGDCAGAQRAFDEIEGALGARPNAVHHANLIGAYAKAGRVDGVMRAFDSMRAGEAGAGAGARGRAGLMWGYTQAIKALVEASLFAEAEALLREMLAPPPAAPGAAARPPRGRDAGSERSCRIAYTIVCDGHSRAGAVGDVLRLVNEMREAGIAPDLITYTTLVRALCKADHVDRALRLIERMRRGGAARPAGAPPAGPGAPGAGPAAGDWLEGEEAALAGVGPDARPNQLTYSCVLMRLAEMGRPHDAEDVMKMMAEDGLSPDVVTFNALLSAYCKVGMFVRARVILEEMREAGVRPNVASFSTLIASYCAWEMFEEAIDVLEVMEDRFSTMPTLVVYSLLINEMRRMGRFNLAITEFHKMTLAGVEADVYAYNTVMDCYSKLGSLEGARGVLDRMIGNGVRPNTVTMNILVGCTVRHGEGAAGRGPGRAAAPAACPCDAAGALVERMRAEHRCEPDTITYNHLLSCYGAAGKLGEGRALLDEIRRRQTRRREGARPLTDGKTASIVAKYFAAAS